MASIFANLPPAPVIQVFALSEECKQDSFPEKVNLTIGAYRDEEGKPWVLPVVKKCEKALSEDNTLNKEYLPITGMPEFCNLALKLLLGDSQLLSTNKAEGVQALGGTGALYLAVQFLSVIMKKQHIYISKPTWPNHRGLAQNAGFQIHEYRYWDPESKNVDFAGLMEDLNNAENNSVVILHACAHNPTGMDLSKSQWTEVCDVIKKKELFPLMDIAYQGFATGDLENDAWAVRYFAEEGLEMFVAQSFSKNFGLYNQRIGNLAIITKDPHSTFLVKDQLKVMIRKCWSNPPEHGARIISSVLSNPALNNEWKESVATMANRVKLMRRLLFEELRRLGTPGKWDHIVNQIGMFSYTGLTEEQAVHMRKFHHVYLLNDGRINMCGLNKSNVEYVAKAIHDILTNSK